MSECLSKEKHYSALQELTHYHKQWKNHLAFQLPSGHHQKKTPESGRHGWWTLALTQHVLFYPTIELFGRRCQSQRYPQTGGQPVPTAPLQHGPNAHTLMNCLNKRQTLYKDLRMTFTIGTLRCTCVYKSRLFKRNGVYFFKACSNHRVLKQIIVEWWQPILPGIKQF